MKTNKKLFYIFIIFLVIFLGIIISIKTSLYKQKKIFAEELNILPSFAQIEQQLQLLPVPPETQNSVKIPIFIYHSVRPHYAHEPLIQDVYDVDPILFEKQLQYLNDNGFTTISLDTFMEYVKNGIPERIKPVVLTFDDGWENQYKYAFPLLKKYHATGTFYIYTYPIDTKKELFLTWDEIKEMDRAGMTIAAHTVHHPLFSHMEIPEIRKELVDSKQILEAELGKPINHFASPFGSTSREIQNLIKEAGYKTGRTSRRGSYHTINDFFQLRGVIITDNIDDFIKALQP